MNFLPAPPALSLWSHHRRLERGLRVPLWGSPPMAAQSHSAAAGRIEEDDPHALAAVHPEAHAPAEPPRRVPRHCRPLRVREPPRVASGPPGDAEETVGALGPFLAVAGLLGPRDAGRSRRTSTPLRTNSRTGIRTNTYQDLVSLPQEEWGGQSSLHVIAPVYLFNHVPAGRTALPFHLVGCCKDLAVTGVRRAEV